MYKNSTLVYLTFHYFVELFYRKLEFLMKKMMVQLRRQEALAVEVNCLLIKIMTFLCFMVSKILDRRNLSFYSSLVKVDLLQVDPSLVPKSMVIRGYWL